MDCIKNFPSSQFVLATPRFTAVRQGLAMEDNGGVPKLQCKLTAKEHRNFETHLVRENTLFSDLIKRSDENRHRGKTRNHRWSLTKVTTIKSSMSYTAPRFLPISPCGHVRNTWSTIGTVQEQHGKNIEAPREQEGETREQRRTNAGPMQDNRGTTSKECRNNKTRTTREQ